MAKQKGRHWLRIGVYRSSITGENDFMSPIPNMQACCLYPEKDEEMEEKILHSFFPADLVDLAFGLGLAVWLVIIKPSITLKVLVHYPTCIAMRCGKYCSIQSNPTNSANHMHRRNEFQYSNQMGTNRYPLSFSPYNLCAINMFPMAPLCHSKNVPPGQFSTAVDVGNISQIENSVSGSQASH